MDLVEILKAGYAVGRGTEATCLMSSGRVALLRSALGGFRRVVAGTTFRLYASHKLQCDPMRVSKRFTHDKKIGLLKYQPKVSLASRRIDRPFRPLSLTATGDMGPGLNSTCCVW